MVNNLDYNSKNALIVMKDIVKEFPGVKALSNISFDVCPGEIHCLIGENGAGKSTLMKIISGAYSPTSGSISIENKKYNKLIPTLSKELGIEIVYQENDLVPTMDVVENIFVGNEITNKFGIIDKLEMKRQTLSYMEKYKIELEVNKKIENLSVSDQQFVKILKALSGNPRILILDEPTSMFNASDAQKVLTLTKNISKKGISVIYISHFLNEVVSIADRITVLRDGLVINTYSNKEKNISLNLLTKDMVGRPVDMFYVKDKSKIGNIILTVKDLQISKNSPKNSFNLRSGEILGFSGIVGSGRTEIVRALTGADRKEYGKIYLNNKEIKINNPKDSIEAGFAFITEDRQELGLMLNHSVLENMIILGYKKKIKNWVMNMKDEIKDINPIVKNLNIKTPSVFSKTINLSGGNQQKVVLGKWLYVEKDIYIFDEPTRGIDVNAKTDFYREMTKLTKLGKSIIMISSDMPELISMSDRVLIVRDGAITHELIGDQINEQNIITQALGVNENGR